MLRQTSRTAMGWEQSWGVFLTTCKRNAFDALGGEGWIPKVRIKRRRTRLRLTAVG
jgi:hypothetical protein